MGAMPGRARSISLGAIVSRLGGRVVGDPEVTISQVGSLENATEGQIAFYSNPRFKSRLGSTRASAVLLAPSAENLTPLPKIVADNPYAYFARLSKWLNPEPAVEPGPSPFASIDPTARISDSASIGPFAVVGPGAVVGDRTVIGAGCVIGTDVEVGEETRLYPSVVIYSRSRIGARVIIHSGAVIGADGFGIAADEGRWEKIPQIGRVLIGDDVEIGANTTVDRGAIDDTVIEEGVKLDNQIQIGHNCHVGAHTAMAGCVAVAGSAHIGRHCTIGAGAIILGHLTIADHVSVSAATVISRSVRKAGTYTGMYPFDENAAWAKNTALVRHLSEFAERIRVLEKRLSEKEEDNE